MFGTELKPQFMTKPKAMVSHSSLSQASKSKGNAMSESRMPTVLDMMNKQPNFGFGGM